MGKMKFISEQEDWDELIDLISEDNLTPVVGREMYKFRDNNELSPIDTYLSKKLFEKFNIPEPPPITLIDALNYFENKNKEDPGDGEIIKKLKSILKEINFDFPLLTDLFEILKFKYFINTTVYNDILERKLKQIRKIDDNQKISINFELQASLIDCADLEKLTEPFVFNVFGSTKSTDPALSDEDLLEYTSNFKEKMKDAKNLSKTLESKSLLFLGCAYPDWMTRFVLRLLTSQRLNDWGKGTKKIYVINDISEFREKQNKILQNYGAITFDGGTEEFMKQLSHHWKKKNSEFEKPKSEKPKSVFLSYTRDDTQAVENLKRALEQIGNIECWYDNKSLLPGVDWEREIGKKIRTSDLFIPLTSANSLKHDDGYVHQEWYLGHIEWKIRNPNIYLIPIWIDESKIDIDGLNNHFKTDSINIKKILNGNPDGDFLNNIKEILNTPKYNNDHY